MSENVFQGAIELLKEERILTVSQILSLFAKYGVTLYWSEIEELLHLEKGTLEPNETQPRIIQLKSKDNK